MNWLKSRGVFAVVCGGSRMPVPYVIRPGRITLAYGGSRMPALAVDRLCKLTLVYRLSYCHTKKGKADLLICVFIYF